MMRFRPLLLAPLLLALSACGLFLTSKEKAMHKDPNYQSGYSDGCAAANAQDTDYRKGGGNRDQALFDSSKPYRSGWHSGFSACHSGYAPDPGSQTGPLPGGGPLH